MSSKSKFSSQLGLKMCCFLFSILCWWWSYEFTLPPSCRAIWSSAQLWPSFHTWAFYFQSISIFNLEQTIFTTNSFQCTVRLCSSAPFVSLPEKPKPKAKTKRPSPRTHDLVEGVFKGVVKEEVASELGGWLTPCLADTVLIWPLVHIPCLPVHPWLIQQLLNACQSNSWSPRFLLYCSDEKDTNGVIKEIWWWPLDIECFWTLVQMSLNWCKCF